MISLIVKQLLGLGAIGFFPWTSSLQTIIANKQAPRAPGNVSLSRVRFTHSRSVCRTGTGRRNDRREKQKYGFKTKTSYCQKQSHFTAEGAEIAEEAFSLFTNKTIALLWRTDKEDSLRACVSKCDDRQDPHVKHKNT